jgi:hydroxymethylbilane synthase
LALWQTHYVADLLKAQQVNVEIVPFETKGDKILDRSLAKIGSKGVFTEELEQALREKALDIAVHSAKDLQSDLGEEFEILAFCEREEAADVLVSYNPELSIKDDIVIGTSSTRRRALLKHYYPNTEVVNIRGNLQTRFRKMKDGLCDAMILAYAGVHRMQYLDRVIQKMDKNSFTPPVGQGAVAIESHVDLASEKKEAIRKACNHTVSETRLEAERAFLKVLNGGCSIPSFGYANMQDGAIHFTGGLVDLEGKELLRVEGVSTNADALGKEMAHELLKKGGRRILDEIRKAL